MENAEIKKVLTYPETIRLAAEVKVDPKTVRRAYEGKRGIGDSHRRAVAALKAAGFLCALLCLQACALEGTGIQAAADTSPVTTTAPQRGVGELPAGTGGQTGQIAADALPAFGGQDGNVPRGTGGQFGAGGASASLGAGGTPEDAGAPAGPEAGMDGAWKYTASDLGVDVGNNRDGVAVDTVATEAEPLDTECVVTLRTIPKEEAVAHGCVITITAPIGDSVWVYEGGKLLVAGVDWGLNGFQPDTGFGKVMLWADACAAAADLPVQVMFACPSYQPPTVLP